MFLPGPPRLHVLLQVCGSSIQADLYGDLQDSASPPRLVPTLPPWVIGLPAPVARSALTPRMCPAWFCLALALLLASVLSDLASSLLGPSWRAPHLTVYSCFLFIYLFFFFSCTHDMWNSWARDQI